MCDRKQQCDEKRDHKDQGMSQEFGDLNKMLDKDENKDKDLEQLRGDIQRFHDEGGMCAQKHCDHSDEKKKMGCGKDKECP
ncbi:hypothetical protein CAEBREN_04006 [Caenorhabditis brenneri]|uniref:Uncharacterized protein n=1 Tax=Caenorhabditis brenneri TaxID=135651 RepID=G0NWD2_CAEBE|nr:hypothetical protein CAEBREN_04006 [Caenorhabditis brenneri]